ncbi:MAG TPA: YcxB family protein [Tepidisphaeraceae bacterium]|jgi:hypothetical protein
MRVEFRYSLDDILDYASQPLWRQLALNKLWVSAALLAAAILLATASIVYLAMTVNTNYWFATAIPIALLASIGRQLLRARMTPEKARKFFDEEPLISEPLAMEADTRGLQFIRAKSRFEYDWSALASCRRTRLLFLIIDCDQQPLIVPKRVFGDPNRLQEFESLLASYVRTN